MNKLILLLIISIFSSVASAQWYEVSAPIYDVCYISSTTVIAVGEGGTIRKSIDKGATWDLIDSKVVWDLYTIFFVNENLGFVSGEKGVLRTTNGGDSWENCFFKQYGDYTWYGWEGLHFLDENLGYILSNTGEVYKTNDGGETWNKMQSVNYIDLKYGYFNTISFLDKDQGYASYVSKTSNGGNLYYTKDRGKSWDLIDPSFPRYVQFVNDKVGYLLRNENIIGKTVDGGKNWEELRIGLNDYILKIEFINEKVGLAVGMFGNILKTVDGGITWNIQNSGVNYSLAAVTADMNGNNGVAVGNNATIVKYNKETCQWDKVCQGPPEDIIIRKVRFASENIAYAVCEHGFITKTTDAGITWSTSIIKDDVDNIDAGFTSIDTGYVLTEEGCVYKTINGGISWDSLGLQNSSLKQIYFYNDKLGFVFDDKWDICYKTTDSGNSWTSIAHHATDMQFLDELVGYSMTDNDLYKTIDGGETWEWWNYPDCYPCANSGKKIDFVNDMVGYTGVAYLYKTIDGGNTWEQLDLPKSSDNEKSDNRIEIDFISETAGYILAGPWYIYRTSDGGNSWNREEYRFSEVYLNHIDFWENNGLAVGDKGRIFKPILFEEKLTQKVVEPVELSVFPNPSTNNRIFIDADLQSDDLELLEIWDMSGRLLLQKKLNKPTFPIEVDLPKHSQGLYIVKLIGQNNIYEVCKVYIINQ